ncbi:hypothetical protein D9V86_12030 [Bacteroidetes/Chlorobi group bacterium ChocPot_Mid]|nr:MAG: hypothetical protein D9V86_12030 [Bacteroidetes/Chlorobi group bacterium ChocPot_Mid]
MKYLLLILALLFVVQIQAQDISWAINKWKTEPLTTQNVARAIIDLQIENPVIVFKQTIKESGWKSGKIEYKSKLALIGNNLFGMRKANKRLTTCLAKTYCGYATYSHWIYSILDYKYWQESKPKKKQECYKKYLIRRGYARNTKRYVKNFNQYILPENIAKILKNENKNYYRKNNYYFAYSSNPVTARVFLAIPKTKIENCLFGQREKGYNRKINFNPLGSNNCKSSSKNYLQRNSCASYSIRYCRNEAVHSRIRYDNKRYFQYTI